MLKLLAAASLMAAPALAPNSTMTSDAWPPARFQGDNASTVLFVAPGLIDQLCGKAPAGYRTEACSDDNLVILPNPCLFPHDDNFARLTCHEIGHVAGWPASHGDAMRRV